jgi:ABC-type multidrug transport system ATPase subunit
MSPVITSPPAFEIRDFTVGYNATAVLRCDHLELFRGEALALLGASGSGKTTFFTALAGNAKPLGGRMTHSAGTVSQDWLRRKVARTLQNFPLLHWLTVEQNLRLAARLRGLPCEEPRRLLGKVAAEHLIQRLPHTLSGGERCRASLAICLLSEPELLLLDEPFNGLDVLVKKEVAETIGAFIEQEQCAAVIVTHNLEDALAYCRRVAVIQRGNPARVTNVWNSGEPSLHEKILNSLS